MGVKQAYAPVEGASDVIEFEREPLTQALEVEILPLAAKHYYEVAPFPDIPFDPNFDQYERADMDGVLRVYTERREGCLVGYCFVTVSAHPHAKKSIQARIDSIYLMEHLRGRGLGTAFIEWISKQLATEGVEVFYVDVTSRHDFSGVLKFLKFKEVDRVFALRLSPASGGDSTNAD